jgi:4'-phosphopantetheinyl transferase
MADPPAGGATGETQSAFESGWPFSSTHPALAGDEIHVWCAWLDELVSDVPAFVSLLSDSERKRADRFQFDRDYNRFIVRHGWLRMILGSYLSIEPARVAFTYESRGKPIASAPGHATPFHFNLSHSNGLALIAATRQAPLGIDVERVRFVAEADEVAAKFFSPHEGAMLNALPAEQKMVSFFHCWTRKEAYLKATGEGIADALPRIEVSLTPGQPARLSKINGDALAASRWRLGGLAPAPGFVGALAIKADSFTLSCWRWPRTL